MTELEKMLAVAVQVLSELTGRDVEAVRASLADCIVDTPPAPPPPLVYLDGWPGTVN